MDNASKALYMAVGVLLFIFALSTSIILYSRIIDLANISVAVSDFGERAESGISQNTDHKRTIRDAEVVASIMQINSLNVKEIKVKNKKGQIITYGPGKDAGNPYEIYVDNKPKDYIKYNFSVILVEKGSYTSSYRDGSLIYTYDGE